MDYKFSVGKMKLYQSAVLKKTIVPARSIEVSYNMSTHTEVESDGTPVDQIKEQEQLTITCEYAETSLDTTLIKGQDYDVTLETGTEGGGVAATIAGCKLTGFSLKQTQDNFVIGTLTFTKIGAIDSAPGSTPTKQTVKFGSTFIGDSAYVIPEYSGNVQAIIVPTALGVLIQSTTDMGGGQLTLRVAGYVKKSTRIELEQYLVTLFTSLSTTSGTLTVAFGATTYTITGCYFVAGRPDGNKKLYTNFELEFIKSAY